MKKHYLALLAKINARTKNERVYLLIALFVVIGSVWNSLVREPWLKKRDALQGEYLKVKEKTGTFEVLERQLMANKDKDINLPLRENYKKKQAELQRLEVLLKDSARNFLSPGEMNQALRRMMGHMAGVSLVTMESLPGEGVRLQDIQNRVAEGQTSGDNKKTSPSKSKPEQVSKSGSSDEKTPDAVEDVTLYRHGLNVTLDGHYLDIMRFLRQVEALPWTFYWSGLDYFFTGEGVSRTKINLSTMSFSDSYIGTYPDLKMTAENLAMFGKEEKEDYPYVDPTIPDPAGSSKLSEGMGMQGDEEGKDNGKKMVLTSILRSDTRKVAIINGRVLGEKDTVDGMTVVAINPMSVKLLQGKQEHEIFLKSMNSRVKKELIMDKKP